MNSEPREPSRLPVRGTIAAVGTVGALALLLSFQGGPLAPSEPVLAAADDPDATDELIAGALTETSGAEAVVEPITVTGDLVPTRWGDVQVEVTLEGSDVTEVVALALPDGDQHSADISDYVGPVLREEAIAYDSAEVSVISGATYTSEAYAQSLQSALDQSGATAEPAVVAEADLEFIADEPAEEVAIVAEEPVEEVAAVTEADEVVTATGDAVAIRWGDVQVAVTVQGDDIIEVQTLAIPTDDRKSERINTYAEPVLREEAIATDSADVSVISGATYTSEAYAASLQSALDQLGV